MPQLISLKTTLLILPLIAATACQQQDSVDEAEQVTTQPSAVIQLNDHNVKEFSITLAEHYQLMLDELLHGFNEAKEKDDSHIFVSYRNFHWTPSYIEKKEYYQQIREKNLVYLANSPARRLFDHFERLIYIGLDLKHGLNDNDQALLRKTFVIIDNDKREIEAVLKLIANSQQP